MYQRRQTGALYTELRDSVFIYPDSRGCVDTKYPVNAASVSFNKLPQKKKKVWQKMIQAEDVLMGTKSSRHYAAHTSSWISIIAATSSHQSQFPPGAPALAPPGASRIRQRLRRGGRAGICHSQLLPTLHLCQDTPDQQTIKPFYKR